MIRLLAIVALVGSLGLVAWGGTATRALPESYLPAQPARITLTVVPTPGLDVYAIEEWIPAGWTPQNISHAGAFDGVQGKLKWGPFLDDAIRILSFEVVPPANAREPVAFAGFAAFNHAPPEPVLGPGILAPPPNSAFRILPTRFNPGESLTVEVSVVPSPLTKSWGVEEDLPEHWTLLEVLNTGVVDTSNRRLKWGPFSDTTSRVLRYRIRAPLDGPDSVPFSGRAAFDERTVTIAGSLQLPKASPTATRHLPEFYAPGFQALVTLDVTPLPSHKTYGVEESIPVGWTVASFSHAGRWDPVTRKIKWGPFDDTLVRQLTYQATPSASAAPLSIFSGQASFDLTQIPVAGDTSVGTELSRIQRTAPERAVVGRSFDVAIEVVPARHVRSVAIEETPPSGWTVANMSHGGRFDAATGKVKWGPFDTAAARTLSYSITVPQSAGAIGTFSGNGAFDGTLIPIAGATEVERSHGVVQRTLPTQFLESTPIQVTLTATPTPNEKAYVVEESLPAGWTHSNPSDGAILDAANRKLKWGPFHDATPRTLRYSAHPPTGVTGPQVFSGSAAFDDRVVPIGGDRITELRPNRAPVVLPIQADRPPDRSIKISRAKLVARASDPDFDAITLVSAGPRSEAGAVVFAAGAFVVYLPPPGFNGPDQFWATIQDSQGARERLPVFIQVLPPADVSPPNAASIFALPNGSVRIVFLGIPQLTYLIQASQDLNIWTTLGDGTADDVGFFEWVDTEASLYPGRFYRSIAP